MSTTRGIAAAAMFAGLAVGLAAPASAGPTIPDTLSGHFNVTETVSSGQSKTEKWDVTSCGVGCANITVSQSSLTPGTFGPFSAQLINGQWVWDEPNGFIVCDDGSQVPDATDNHYAIDANTLRGVNTVAYHKSPCGFDNAGKTFTHTVNLVRS